jgi:hypothetical protein
MAVVPVDVDQMAIICVVFGDLFFCNFKAVFVLKVAICKFEYLLGPFAS